MSKWDLLSAVDIPVSTNVAGVYTVDEKAEVALVYDADGQAIRSVDISDPENLTVLDTLDLSATNWEPQNGALDRSLQKALVSAGDSTDNSGGAVLLIDYSSPGSLVREDTLSPDNYMQFAPHLDEENRVGYVQFKTGADYGLVTIGYDGGTLSVVQDFARSGFIPRNYVDVDIENSILLVKRRRTSDVQDFFEIHRVGADGQFDTDVADQIAVNDAVVLPIVAVQRHSLFAVANASQGRLDLYHWDGSSISLASSVTGIGDPRAMWATDTGHRLFAITTSGDFYEIDIRDESAPSIIDQQAGWPNSTRVISIPWGSPLYKDDHRAVMFDVVEDYVAAYEVDEYTGCLEGGSDPSYSETV